MADALTNFTDFILKPSEPFAAGVALFGIVWGFFKGVESVLTDDTKLEIAVWLVGVKVGQKLEPWPDTFAKVFDRVFGAKHLTWKCFWRSCVASYAGVLLVLLVAHFLGIHDRSGHSELVGLVESKRMLEDDIVALLFINVIPDYLSLLEGRLLLHRMLLGSGRRVAGLVIVDLLVTWAIAFLSAKSAFAILTIVATLHNYLGHLQGLTDPDVVRGVWEDIRLTFDWSFNSFQHIEVRLWFYPTFFTSVWLWLYAGSGFLLKAARRFDIGFDWFNRKFDIEKKPLQSIGLVAGALVALVYWTAVIVSRVI